MFFKIIFLTQHVYRSLSLSLTILILQFLNPNLHQNPLPLNDDKFTKATNKKEDRDQTSETLLKLSLSPQPHHPQPPIPESRPTPKPINPKR